MDTRSYNHQRTFRQLSLKTCIPGQVGKLHTWWKHMGIIQVFVWCSTWVVSQLLRQTPRNWEG
jgi:hypothetical protein